MGLGDKLLQPGYIPNSEINLSSTNLYFKKSLNRCPVPFTSDPFEYIEGYIQYKLRPFQRQVVEDIFSVDSTGTPKYDIASLIIGMRCLGLGTEILMYDGTLKKIEDIRIYDLLMGPDSKPRKVLSLSRGRSLLYEVKQSCAITYVVNENHILSLKKDKLEIINIPIKEYLQKPKKLQSSLKGYKADFSKDKKLSSLKVQSIGIGKYAGIEVDGDNLFCLSDGTVTHNSGKSLINAVIGSYLLHVLLSKEDPAAELGQIPHYKLSALFIANSEQQSKRTAYAAFDTILSTSPWWNKYIGWLRDRELTEGKDSLFLRTQKRMFFLEKNLEILSLTSSSQSGAGTTAFFVSFEELSRANVSTGPIQDTTEQRSAQAIYYTFSRATKSLYPFSKIIVTTSPMYETDFGMQLLYMSKDFRCGQNAAIMNTLRTKHYPAKVDRMIAYNYTSFEANPRTIDYVQGFTEDSFKAEKEANPTAAMRDYWAIPPSAISPFFDIPDRIDKCIAQYEDPIALFENYLIEETVDTPNGIEMRNYIAKRIVPVKTDKIRNYFLCCDQGEKVDSFVIAMGHGEAFDYPITNPATGKEEIIKKYKIIIDLVEAWKPRKHEKITVSFQNVEENIRRLSQLFNIRAVTFDQWHSTESIQRLFSQGIHTEKLGANLEMYETFKLLIYSGMVIFPNDNELISELKQLNIVKGGGGHFKIDHSNFGCFTGDTKIKLLDGTIPTLKELADKGIENEFWVYSCLEDGTIVPAKAHNAHKTKSVTEICEVTLDNNEIIKCTPDHLFMLRNGEYKQAKDLNINESLMPLYTKLKDLAQEKDKKRKKYYLQIYSKNKWIYVHRFVVSFFGPHLNKGEVVHHKNFNKLDNTPENLERMTYKEHNKLHQKLFANLLDPKTRKKAIESRMAKFYQHLRGEIFVQGFENFLGRNGRTKAQKENTTKQYEKYFTKEVLSANGKKFKLWLNSPEGKQRWEELKQTTFKERGKEISADYTKMLMERLGWRKDYIIGWNHARYLVGGMSHIWEKRISSDKWKENAKRLEGKTYDEIFYLTGLKTKTQITRYLKKINMEYVISNNKNHKVIKLEIKKLEEPIDVYDISVPIYENFALDSGIFVHNSKDKSDSVCRVSWKIYNESIKDSIHDNFMLPTLQRFATVRSAGEYFESLKGGNLDGDYGIFGSSNAGADDIFGKSMIVKGNVVPNLND